MKRTLSLIAVLTLATTLASCGKIVGSLVPAQTVENPAGLDGKVLAPSSPLTIESVRGTVSYSTAGSTFGDIEYPDNVPFGIRPRAVEFQAGFSEAVVTGACVAAAPATVAVTLKSLALEVRDAAGKASFSDEPNVTFTLTRSAAAGGSVTYAVSDKQVSLKADAQETDAFIRTLTEGGANEASLDATISADQNSLAGCTMSFKLRGVKVILSNFS
ncbi:hypothetical protein [Deinococcus sp. UR1]|uniref:hypothetical protein n=1 Tax=Deinococcus sp. UR1 TaxID=1704277 RepID=UPI0006DC8771|nr:hypothetical protein [Deinococcus sp. UR1]PIG99121.1 hypothetical protein AMD26_005040 [Deinococcus sp. UR1]